MRKHGESSPVRSRHPGTLRKAAASVAATRSTVVVGAWRTLPVVAVTWVGVVVAAVTWVAAVTAAAIVKSVIDG